MEPKFQTSFIPKKPIVASEGVVKKSIDFFAIVAVILFLGSLVLSAAVYAWEYTLTKKVATSEKALVVAREQFDQAFIGYVNRLNTKIETSKSLLGSHVGASTIFGFLASHTLKTISYTNFSYSYEADGTVKVVLNGIAKSYGTVALQSEEFGKQNQYIKSPIFSNLNPDQNGNVTFTLTALLDKNLISYQKNLGQTIDSANTQVPANSQNI
ncbi:MAG: hypothetical protein WCJ74_02830 [bacterium]